MVSSRNEIVEHSSVKNVIISDINNRKYICRYSIVNPGFKYENNINI